MKGIHSRVKGSAPKSAMFYQRGPFKGSKKNSILGDRAALNRFRSDDVGNIDDGPLNYDPEAEDQDEAFDKDMILYEGR